jgi:2-polyprenyl-3-methyl-5-hydroxy-6-metoxy-1,4-benzoquinol methylase
MGEAIAGVRTLTGGSGGGGEGVRGGRGSAGRASCPVCCVEAPHRLSSKDYNQKTSPDLVDYRRCSTCGLVFAENPPGSGSDHYPAGYHAIPPSLRQLAKRAAREEHKIEVVRRHATGGKLLEVGPSYGAFSWLAKREGFEVEAIEQDPACCRFLSDVVGIRAINSSDVRTALEGLGTYRVVALWHVIEHLPDPFKVLEALGRKVLPGGILVVAAPNPDSFQFRILGKRWPHLDAPRHLTLIPASLIATRMATLGFTAAVNTTAGRGSREYDTFGWTGFFTSRSSSAFAKKLLWLLGLAVSIVARPLDRRQGRGSSYTMVLVKEG